MTAPETTQQLDGMTAAGYPRPNLRRSSWLPLDGAWDFAFDPDGSAAGPDDVAFDRVITVPFAPETEASGIACTGHFAVCWYRRRIERPADSAGKRVILHFGAVDYRATVWLDDHLVGRHVGGYTPFEFDIGSLLTEGSEHTLVVRAEDDPHDLTQPRGKQDWKLEPHSIWYPRTSGIWQSVWMEVVPDTAIRKLRLLPHMEQGEIELEAEIGRARTEDVYLHVRLTARGATLSDDRYLVVAGEVHRGIRLSDPGVDNFRNELLWQPQSPTLIDAEIELRTESGALLDRVRSYTALRSVSTQGGRFLLNARPQYLRLVLDQGYWPETGLTPPSDEAIRRDVELVREMGFNGVRKHQKVEDPRYLYWADRLGVMVWAEMPSAYRFTARSVRRLVHEWSSVIERDRCHPCVVAWVPLNESWGVPDLTQAPAQRSYVGALYHLTRTLDPDRPVIGNDGWESSLTDIIGIHDYDPEPERLKARYGADRGTPLLESERPGGRPILLAGHEHAGQPMVLSEFGGITLTDGPGTWGYSTVGDGEALSRRYESLIDAIGPSPLLAGFCYTQFADTYQETNGLLHADRTPKFPLEDMCRITRRPLTEGWHANVPGGGQLSA